MADLSAVTDKYFTIASETFTDNLSSSISAGATTVPVLNNSEYTNGDDVVLTVDPGTVNEATFIGRKSGLNFINCVWTEGNIAVGHSNGATIIDYDSATHHNAQTKGIQVHANSNGTLKTQPVRDALGLGATATNGWEVLPNTLSVTTGYNKGNKEFDITVANADVTSTLAVGMKLRLERGTAAPGQCADLERSSSQFASRVSASVTGTISTITDDFTIEAWANPESYNDQMLLSRLNAAASQGFFLQLLASGKIRIGGRTTAGGTGRDYDSQICYALGKWQHFAATLDMSGNLCTIYLNGVSLPVLSAGGTASALQAGTDLHIGNFMSSTQYFDGKLSDVRMWNVIRTATQIRDNMNQSLVGTETNLIGYWKLNGDFVDSTSSANTLTGQGGAVATFVENPMKSTEYAIIHKIAYGAPNTTITVFTGTDYNIPNMTLNAPYYSTQKSPYGFPTDRGKWRVEAQSHYQMSAAIGAAGFATPMNYQISIPTGDWIAGYAVAAQFNPTVGAAVQVKATLSTTSGNTETDRMFSTYGESGATTASFAVPAQRERPISLTTQTIYYLNVYGSVAGTVYARGDNVGNTLYAESAYI